MASVPIDKILHKSAVPSHYDQEANTYDQFNEKNSAVVNKTIEAILAKKKIKTILDLACGTGSQAFWFSQLGYDVRAYDINFKMLKIARKKAKQQNSNITFSKGDMRTTRVGQFDVVMTIFNAIGHLTTQDFAKSLHNIRQNLVAGGLYVFDIFNLNYLLDQDNITKLTIDWQKEHDGHQVREIQYSTISQVGILTSYDTYIEQKNNRKAKITHAIQTVQTYNAVELKAMLEKGGFNILKCCEIDGSRFNDKKTERILVVAKSA